MRKKLKTIITSMHLTFEGQKLKTFKNVLLYCDFFQKRLRMLLCHLRMKMLFHCWPLARLLITIIIAIIIIISHCLIILKFIFNSSQLMRSKLLSNKKFKFCRLSKSRTKFSSKQKFRNEIWKGNVSWKFCMWHLAICPFIGTSN